MSKKPNKHTKPARNAEKTTGRSGEGSRRNRSRNPFSTRLSAHVTEEGEWITEPPNLTLSRMFLVVLLLHIVIVGGILAFEMFKDNPVAAPASASAKPLTHNRDALGSRGISRGETGGLVESERYRVQAGDTLSEIAKRYRVASADLTAINRLRSGDQIYPGQTLLIPGSAGGTPDVPAPKLPGAVDGDAASMVPAKLAQEFAPKAQVVTPGLGSAPANRVPPLEIPTVVSVPPAESNRTHKVEIGETAFAISRQYGVTVDAILTANGIEDARFLRAGDMIRIP